MRAGFSKIDITPPLDRIEARLNRQPPQGKIATIALELMLGGDLDEEQKRRLLQIAERCPVHRTLQGAVRIVTRAG